jgi:hypothetical protein
MLFLGGDDPVKLDAAANKIAADMQGLPELRARRVSRATSRRRRS